ncbi:MAG: hypothetical protein JXB10_12005 [Pirellulales bacterium]|nr:hypothetical protein [Pirellulales bacterium]
MTPSEKKTGRVVPFDKDQRQRILSALGERGRKIPKVNEKTLLKYYRYLSTHLAFPYPARYPHSSPRWQAVANDFTVLGLLDPSHRQGGEYDGIFCKTMNGNYEVNLPLIELETSGDHPNHQLLEDYWYWFWNWR